MSKIKKVLAVFLTLAMVLGMGMTTFAAGTDKDHPGVPDATDAALVSVENIEAGATLTAYQIVDAAYDKSGNGVTGYIWAPGTPNAGQKANLDEITSDSITELAKNTAGLTEVKQNFNPTETKLEVGTWMIIVTPPAQDAEKVYNPMIVSVYYSTDLTGDNNYPIAGSVDANTNWTLATKDAFAKSSDVTISKTVTDAKQEVGKTVEFTIKSTIPSYSSEYVNPIFEITDKIVNGLEYTTTPPVVKVNNQPLTDGTDYDYKDNGNSFTISFKSDYISKLAGKTAEERAVEVTYSATVTSEAITQIGENDVTLNYSTTPSTTSDAKKDHEYTYTFELNGIFQKVGDDNKGLEGAEFTLFRKYENGEVSGKVDIPNNPYVTKKDNDFNILFQGLDSDNTYYLKETKAPNGYSINDTVYTITFNPKFTNDTDGKQILESYEVLVDGKVVSTINYGTPADEFAITVKNTKVSELPSTGGIGTTIFTIGGCLIMIIAAALFFASRRKENK